MDLSHLDLLTAANAGVKMSLRHPTTGEVLEQEDGTPITLTLLGQDSSAYKKQIAKVADVRLRRQSERGKAGSPITMAGFEADSIEALSICTVGWDGVRIDNAPLEHSREAAKELYTRFSWMREQVDAFVADRSNFLPA